MIVRIDYPQPGVRLDLWGGTSGTFAGLDAFGRVVDQRWQNGTGGTPADVDRYRYGYDRDSNRQYKANAVGTPVVSGGLDELYAYDPLNRLTAMQRGVLNSTKTGISGTPSREMDWSLDPTGNWSGYQTKTSGTTDLNQARASNTVNEITAVTESSGPAWATPAYDAAGNMTTVPQVADPAQSFTATYDAWNRMTGLSDASGTVATYGYDGRNRRIVKATAAETRHYYFTDNWQDVEERVGASTVMDVQYVWGVRYVDELVCRDDATASPPRRLYALQDANFNVTAITDAGGGVAERYRFDPYGGRAVLGAGWAPLAASAYAWVVGHQGLAHEPESGIVYNRHRYLHSALGRFTVRDPHVPWTTPNCYEYVDGAPTDSSDPLGLETIEIKNDKGKTVGNLNTGEVNCAGYACHQKGAIAPIEDPEAARTSLKSLFEALGYKCDADISAADCKSHCNCKDYVEMYVYIIKTYDFKKVRAKYKGKDPYADPVITPDNELDYHALRGEDSGYTYQPSRAAKGSKGDYTNQPQKFTPTEKQPDYFPNPDQLLGKYCCCKK